MTFALGKHPARHDPRTLKLAGYATPAFTVPVSKTWAHGVPSWPMLSNDRYGDCVEAGAYHLTQSWLDNDGVAVVPTDHDTLQAYSEITGFNPADPSTDGGTNMLDALNYWRRRGMPWTVNGHPMRHEIAGYAQTDHANTKEIKLAIAEFGGAFVGAAMPLSAQSQFAAGKHWTVGRGPNAAPGSWGGHCVVAVGYTSSTVDLVTWGQVQQASWGWFHKYVDEVYAVLSTDWTGPDGQAPSNVNLEQLRTDIGRFT